MVYQAPNSQYRLSESVAETERDTAALLLFWKLVRVMLKLEAHIGFGLLQCSGTDTVNVVTTHPVQRVDECVVVVGLVGCSAFEEIQYLWD